MRLDDLDSPAWRRALARGRRVAVLPVTVEYPDHQVWRALSDSVRNGAYRVTLDASPDGLTGACDCPAGAHDKPCKHLASVLLATGHARWWTHVVGERDAHGQPSVWLVNDEDRALLADQRAGIEWGYGGSGPWWLACLILRAMGRDTLAAPLVKERFLAGAPWQGFTLSARRIDAYLAELDAELEGVA